MGSGSQGRPPLRPGAPEYAVKTTLPALVAALALLGCGPTAREPPPPSLPNVFLIVIDTLRPDRLGSYGREPALSPNIDRFAREAVVYRRAYAPSSWTKTSVASLLTGLHPYRHRVFTEARSSRLPSSAITVGERLQGLGYRTVAASMNPHVSRASGFDQGFETFASQSRWENGHNEEVTRAVIMDLARAPRDRPLFLYLHYLDPHDPWHPEDACKTRLAAAGITNRAILEGQAFYLSGESDIEDLAESSETPRPASLSPTEKAYLEGLYECEISMVDAAVGGLLGYLADERWLQDALVVIAADHGEEFWEHGMMRHGYQLFEETVRVPLIVKPPASRPLAGDEDTRLVQLVDLTATIFDLAGIEAAGDGASLFQTVPKGAATGAFGMTAFRNQHQAFLVEDHLKVIDDFERDRCLLFDLEADPAERQPTDCEASDSGRRMRAELEAAKESQTETALPPDAPEDGAGLEEDDDLRQRLEELGYVQ